MHTCAQTRTSFRLLRVQSSKTLSDPFSVAEFAEKMSVASEDNSPQARVADSSSRNAVSFSSARTMKRFPSSRCQIDLGRDRVKDGVTQGDQYDVVTHASYYTERSTDTDDGISNTSKLSPRSERTIDWPCCNAANILNNAVEARGDRPRRLAAFRVGLIKTGPGRRDKRRTPNCVRCAGVCAKSTATIQAVPIRASFNRYNRRIPDTNIGNV
jgi:hypothetical protein